MTRIKVCEMDGLYLVIKPLRLIEGYTPQLKGEGSEGSCGICEEWRSDLCLVDRRS